MAFTALSTGVSGLQAFGEGIGVISDNITNVNTVGYKETRTNFSTLVTETEALQSFSPGGVRASSTTLVSGQGLLEPSASTTDLAIDGAGFFVVRNAVDPEDKTGETLFTRAGSFTQDNKGFLVNTAGQNLLGWPLDNQGNILDTQGNITNNRQDLRNLEPINIDNLNGIAEATDEVSIRANLQSSTQPLTTNLSNGAPLTDPSNIGALTANGTATGGRTVTADFETNVTVFDSLGQAHTVVSAFKKTASNAWTFEVYADNPSELNGAHGSNGLIGRGTLTFNPDGSIDLGNSNLRNVVHSPLPSDLSAGDVTDPSTDADGDGLADENVLNNQNSGLMIDWNDGISNAATSQIDYEAGTDTETNGFTHFDSQSTVISTAVDGAQFDNVNGIQITENGDVNALFKNGLAKTVFRLPVATFSNPEGLNRRQGNAFGASDSSGNFTLNNPNEGGAGKVSPNSLELSTVDLANEFADLIKMQRAFSASTRIITTSDEILTELTQLV
ncbi:flagellar hook protein FlgE [Yunchengibacter salinarum]|uniref:flagellar hook protein FlgE n=1 Tax=Yunchengibacter salinarum TaxID=3133399 RepID=UPI0035B58581